MKWWPAFVLIAQFTCENHAERGYGIQRQSSVVDSELSVIEEEERNFIVNTGKGMLSLDRPETIFSLEKKLGKPIQENNILSGVEGSQKTISYHSLQLKLFSLHNEPGIYRIKEMTITSPHYEIGEGVKVGDSLEKLVRLYPSLWTCIGNRAKKYIATVSNENKTVVFEISNNRAGSIRLYSFTP